MKKSGIKKVYVLILIAIIFGASTLYFNLFNKAFYLPDYEKTDISDLLGDKVLSDKDYLLIYEQTGVSPYLSKELIEKGNVQVLKDLNQMYFKNPDVLKEYILYPITAQEKTNAKPVLNLKKGDVLVTFNTHTLNWRHGHSAIVLDEDNGILLEHMAVGETSATTKLKSWEEYPGFVVLRYPDEAVAENAAEYAKEHLLGIDYNIFAGLIKKDKSDEEKPQSSHCSHIVWQAYKALGVDIDKNKGRIVTPRDIAESEELKVVQIFGINPRKYTHRILK